MAWPVLVSAIPEVANNELTDGQTERQQRRPAGPASDVDTNGTPVPDERPGTPGPTRGRKRYIVAIQLDWSVTPWPGQSKDAPNGWSPRRQLPRLSEAPGVGGGRLACRLSLWMGISAVQGIS